MRIIFFLFVISTVGLAKEIRVKIKPKVIVPTMEMFYAYFKYVEKGRTAYAGLPNSPSVTIEVTAEPNSEDLKIKGPFYQKTWKTIKLLNCVYAKDLYYKDLKFYRFKRTKLVEVPDDTELIYKQEEEKQKQHPYISTTVISMDDLEKEVVSFFAQYKKYYNRIRDVQTRVNFLVTPPNYDGHFIEFNFIRTLGSHLEIVPMPLFGLVGSKKGNEISDIRVKAYPKIDYNEDDGEIIARPRNLLGVYTTGLLAISDATDSEHPILLNYLESVYAKRIIEEGHEVTSDEFLKKLQTIEPAIATLNQAGFIMADGNIRSDIIPDLPKVLFQIGRHTMAKQGSIVYGNNLNHEWPFMVEFHGHKGRFQLDILSRTVFGKRMYTDDNRLALAASDGKIYKIKPGHELRILYQ